MAKSLYTGADFKGNKATNLADPSLPNDAVNLQYLLNFIRGLINKDAVRAASTGQVSLTAPGSSIDGVALAVNDRVLIKDNTTGSERGIYVWNGASVAMTRALDADSGTELRPGTTVYVTEGTTNADKNFSVLNDGVVTIGTTAQTWGVTGGATVAYAAGFGILLSAGVISINTGVIARNFSQTIGDGSATSFTITHGLNTKDLVSSIRLLANDEVVEADVFFPTLTTANVVVATPLAANAARLTLVG